MPPGDPSQSVVVLVEGESDAVVVRHLLAAQDALDAVAVLPMGGITNVDRWLGRVAGRHSAGLYDAAERRFVTRALRRRGVPVDPGADLAEHGFFECVADLEEELIRALGPAQVVEALDAIGDGARFETFVHQPQWRDRPIGDQLHRFAGSGSGRKALLAEQLAQRLTPATTPAPLAGVVAHALALAGARTA